MIDIGHIPEAERKKKWFLLIEPLVRARCLRSNWPEACLVKAMQRDHGWGSWKTVKASIELALQNVVGAESIFSRASHIHTDPDPDGVIDDMFAEVRAIPYMLLKGFVNVGYRRRDGLDFSMEFKGKTYNLEVAYIRGEMFKTQKPRFKSEVTGGIVYELEARKLVSRLKTTCDRKEEQAVKHGGSFADTIVFVISDLEEMYEKWLEHDEFRGQHPILGVITSREFPTVIFGPGTVYEPLANALDGVFGQLLRFEWPAFERLVPRDPAKGNENVSA